MAGFEDDSIAWATGEALGALVPAELAARGLPTVCQGGVLPGAEAPFDSCGGDCPGMWWVRLVQLYPSSQQFPEADQLSHSKRPILLAQQYEVGLMRSIEVPPNGEALEFVDQNAAASLQLADMRALLNVICNYFRGQHQPFVVGQYVPYGPQGGCVGGSWLVTAGVKP